jgi:hypothetical protein
MGRPLRNSQARPSAYWETIRGRIECGKAVEVVNQALNSNDLPAHQLNTAIFVINKMLPSLQAISVQVEHKASANWQDLQARALEAGIDPELLLATSAKKPSITQEKIDSPAD